MWFSFHPVWDCVYGLKKTLQCHLGLKSGLQPVSQNLILTLAKWHNFPAPLFTISSWCCVCRSLLTGVRTGPGVWAASCCQGQEPLGATRSSVRQALACLLSLCCPHQWIEPGRAMVQGVQGAHPGVCVTYR